MPEIGTSGSMSGDGKRGVAEWPKLPRPSSTLPSSRRKPRARNMGATWPQVSRFDPVSARGCGLCQGAERSAGVSVFDEGSLIDELFVAFAVAVD